MKKLFLVSVVMLSVLGFVGCSNTEETATPAANSNPPAKIEENVESPESTTAEAQLGEALGNALAGSEDELAAILGTELEGQSGEELGRILGDALAGSEDEIANALGLNLEGLTEEEMTTALTTALAGSEDEVLNAVKATLDGEEGELGKTLGNVLAGSEDEIAEALRTSLEGSEGDLNELGSALEEELNAFFE